MMRMLQKFAIPKQLPVAERKTRWANKTAFPQRSPVI